MAEKISFLGAHPFGGENANPSSSSCVCHTMELPLVPFHHHGAFAFRRQISLAFFRQLIYGYNEASKR